MLGSFLGIGFTSLATTFGLWTLGTARFMFPNVLMEPPSKFKVGLSQQFRAGAGGDEVHRPVRRVDRQLRIQRASRKSMRCDRSARIWVARPTGWKASRSSSVPATAADFTKTASTSRGPLRGRSNGMRFASPMTVSWKSTRASSFRKKSGSGAILLPSSRSKFWAIAVPSGCDAAPAKVAAACNCDPIAGQLAARRRTPSCRPLSGQRIRIGGKDLTNKLQ